MREDELAKAGRQEREDTGAADCEGSWLDRWKTYGSLGGRVVEWSRERRHGEACFVLWEKVLFV